MPAAAGGIARNNMHGVIIIRHLDLPYILIRRRKDRIPLMQADPARHAVPLMNIGGVILLPPIQHAVILLSL